MVLLSSSTSTKGFPKRINKTDIAYSAGILDGEGTLSGYTRHGEGSVIQIVPVINTDKALVQWLQTLWGGRIASRIPKGLGIKEVHTLNLRKDEAKRYLKLVKQFLRIKRPQAECALAYVSLPKHAPKKRRRLIEKIHRLNQGKDDTVSPNGDISE